MFLPTALHIVLSFCVSTHRLVAKPDDIRDGAGSAVLHDNPQVCVLEVASIVLDYVRAGRKSRTQRYQRRRQI